MASFHTGGNVESGDLSTRRTRWSKFDLFERLNKIQCSSKSSLEREDCNLVGAILYFGIIIRSKKKLNIPGMIYLSFDDDVRLKFGYGNNDFLILEDVILDQKQYAAGNGTINVDGIVFSLHLRRKTVHIQKIPPVLFKDKLKDEKSRTASLVPRWAEQNRPTKQINLRIDPELLSKVEEKASADGLNRTEFITNALLKALERKP